MEDWIRWELALASATPASAVGGHGESWPTHPCFCRFFTAPDARKNRAFFFFFSSVTSAKMWFIYFFSFLALPLRLTADLVICWYWDLHLGDSLLLTVCICFFIFHAEIRFDNVSRTAQWAMCNQKLGTIDDTFVTSQRERFMSAVKPFVATSILYSCCACDLVFFVLLHRDRGRMLSVLLSLWFSSSFVPLCVQYDYEKTAFHLFMKTAFMYFGLGCFSMRGGEAKKKKKTSNLAVMVLKSVMRCSWKASGSSRA